MQDIAATANDLLTCKQEQHTLIPASQRLLFCTLFRECRLLTRSLRT